jgi:sulfate permease, SulP family
MTARALETPPEDSAHWLPAVGWLRRYRREWLRRDLLAALTVWALVVPQGIAYAELAGLPPQAGLFATIAGLVGYALLGTSRQLMVSPTSSTAAISGALVATVAVGDVTRVQSLAAALAILAGAAFVAFGLLRMGFLSRFIAPGVQTGFFFGLGLTIIAGQLPKLFGTPDVSLDFIQSVGGIVPFLDEVSWLTLALGLASLATIILLRRLAPGFPAAIVTVVAGVALVSFFDLADRGVAVLGTVEGGVPRPIIPDVTVSDLLALLPGALILAIVAYTEGITVAERFADTHRYDIRPDQELIAGGGSNMLSGLFGGLIVGGGASQSAAADRAGGQTQLVSFIVAGLTLVTVVALLPLFSNLPQAVLGAIVISAVLGFLDVAALRRLWALRQGSFALALVALAGVLVLGVVPGLLVAVVISMGVLLVSFSRPTGSRMGRLPGTEAFVAIDHEPTAKMDPGVLVYRLNAPVLTLNAKHLRDLVRSEIGTADPTPRLVVVDMTFTSDLDVGTIDVLAGLHRELAERGIALALGNVRGEVATMLERSGLAAAIGPNRIARRLEDAVAGRDA